MIKRNITAVIAGLTLFLTSNIEAQAYNESGLQTEDTEAIEEVSFDIEEYADKGYLEKDIYDEGEYAGTISLEYIEEESDNNYDFEAPTEDNSFVTPYSIDYGPIIFRGGGLNRVRYSNGLKSIGYDLTISSGPTRITRAANPVYTWIGWTVNSNSLTHTQKTANLTLFGKSLISSGTFSLNSRLSNGRILIDVN